MTHKEQSSLFFVKVLCNALEEEGKNLSFLSLPLPCFVCQRMVFSSVTVLKIHNIIFQTEIIRSLHLFFRKTLAVS